MVRKVFYMPKRGGNLKEKTLSYPNFEEALWNSSKGKRDRPEVKYCFDHKTQVYKSILGIEDIKGNYRAKLIVDRASGKIRNVLVPKYNPYQIYHHMLMQVAIPYLLRGSYNYSCGAIKSKGGLYASCYIRKILVEDVPGTRYFAKLDIVHYYENVDHATLKAKFRKVIKDPWFLGKLDSVVDSIHSDKSIPIGNYPSQIFANFYLQGLDDFIKRVLKIPYYVRYMDDIILIGSNKRVLANAIVEVKKYLKDELKLDTHGNEVVHRVAYRDNGGALRGEFIDFVGFKHYRGYTTIRKRTWKRARRLMLRLHRMPITPRKARTFMSYYGYFSHSDSFKVQAKYFPLFEMKGLRKSIREDKPHVRKNRDP